MIQKPPLFVASADQSWNYHGLISWKGIKLEIRNHPARNERKWQGSVGGGAREERCQRLLLRVRIAVMTVSRTMSLSDAPRDKARKRRCGKQKGAEEDGLASSWMDIASAMYKSCIRIRESTPPSFAELTTRCFLDNRIISEFMFAWS